MNLSKYNAPLLLAAVCVVVFSLQTAMPWITDAFLLDSSTVAWQPWTLVTSIFLHGDVMHLFYNMFALVMFGLMLEGIIGNKRFYMLFFVGGIVASVFAALFYNASLGASGAVFAVMGCLAVLRPRMIVWISYIPMPMAVAVIVWLAIDMIGFIAPSGIANAAHIAGLAFGLAYGLSLRRRFPTALKHDKKLLSDEDVDEWENKFMK